MKKLKLTKKQILMITVFLILLFSLIGVFIGNLKKNNRGLETTVPNYIVTQYFIDNSDDTSKRYEVRYYAKKRQSFLTLCEKDGVKVDKTITEVKTDFTNEYFLFSIDTTNDSNVKDLSKYADASGFIYTTRISEIQEFLSNEALNGSLKFTYATPSYFECYIEDKAGNVMRGLLLYEYDFLTGTLIYKKCEEDTIIPNAMDMVIVIEEAITESSTINK